MKRNFDNHKVNKKADCSGCLSRRDVVIAGTVAFATTLSAPPSNASAKSPEKMAVQPGDRLQLIKGKLKGKMLRPEMLVSGEAPIEAFPFDSEAGVLRRGNRLNRILVLKLSSSEMDEETFSRQAEGILAYSAVCTHRGCTVSSWKSEERLLRCMCHLSEFDALSGGSVVSGPAKRQLAMVPLELDSEGYVMARAGFTSKVGGAKK